MKIKKIIVITMAFILLCADLSIFASANNHSDTSFSFTLPGVDYYTVLNSGREKTDDTGSYISSDSSNPSEGALFSIHGYSKSTFSSVSQITNCTKNTSARIWPAQNRRIRQYVYELGYDYAFIGASAITSAGVGKKLIGNWSPDSVGSDPYCN